MSFGNDGTETLLTIVIASAAWQSPTIQRDSANRGLPRRSSSQQRCFF